MSKDELINITCKWLDHFQARYITKTPDGKLVADPKCLTDLRDFLERVKESDYWEVSTNLREYDNQK